MKTRIIKPAGVILLTMLMTTAMNAQSHRQGGRSMEPGEREGRFARLELTETQSEELTTLHTEQYTIMKPLKNKMVELKARERTLLSEESVDLKSVDKVIDQQTDLMNKMKKLQTKHQVAIKNVLTDEQVMKLEQGRRHYSRMSQGQRTRGAGSWSGYGRGSGRGSGRPGRAI